MEETEGTSTEIERNRGELASGGGQRISLAETGGAAAQKNIPWKYFVRDEEQRRSKELEAREKAETSTSSANDKSQLYHTSGTDSELRGVTYRARNREKSAEKKLTKLPEIAETRIDDEETVDSTESERGAARADSRMIARGRRSIESTSLAGNIQKFKRHDKSDEITTYGMSRAPDFEGEGGKKGWPEER